VFAILLVALSGGCGDDDGDDKHEDTHGDSDAGAGRGGTGGKGGSSGSEAGKGGKGGTGGTKASSLDSPGVLPRPPTTLPDELRPPR
jgi:hypothetical protein